MHVYLVANKQNLQLIADRETIEVSLFDFNAEFWFNLSLKFSSINGQMDGKLLFLEHLDNFFNRKLNG